MSSSFSHGILPVAKHVLDNGLTILVRSTKTIPKVAIQLWYGVGSKHEVAGKTGLAHLLEHMTFKGTDFLSETDIATATTKLSGSTNAFTSRDYTGYMFEFPTQHWHISLPLLAECMRDCSLKPDLLNSELRAVVQELKLYRDDYSATLLEEMMEKIFKGHSYEHPIIGYKQDLWQTTSQDLAQFYQQYYVPSNAVLVIVGDVDEQVAIAKAIEYFSAIPKLSYTSLDHQPFQSPSATTVTLHRDVQQPSCMMAFVVPGGHARLDYQLDVLSWLLGSGKGSKLYRILVDEEDLVLEVDAFIYDLFDHSLLCIEFEPKEVKDIDRVIIRIHELLTQFCKDPISDRELMRARKQTETDTLSALESLEKQAYMIGKYYLATGSENYLFTYLDHDDTSLRDALAKLLPYLDISKAHIGKLLPFEQGHEAAWTQALEAEDQQDEQALAGRLRQTTLEPAQFAQKVVAQPPSAFKYPQHQVVTLSNGLRVLFHHNPQIPRIELILELRAQFYYDPPELPGLHAFMSAMLVEGTDRLTSVELAQEIESHGMTLACAAGYIAMSMLTSDFPKGLQLLQEILTKSIFDAKSVEKVRQYMLASIKSHWDEPFEFVDDLVREALYQGHPYSKSRLGTLESIRNITREQLIACYREHITPSAARLSVVGDLRGNYLEDLAVLSQWQGPQIPEIQFPQLSPIVAREVRYPINRDQTVLCFAGRSVVRAHPDYDKLLIFDQVLTGSLLGSMDARLFKLREETGLFYTIGGSVIASADIQPGMILIKTLVSREHVAQAQKLIENLLVTVIDSTTQQEFETARDGIINSLVNNFETNRQMALAFLVLDRFNLPIDYFYRRIDDFYRINLPEVKEAAHRLMDNNPLIVFKVGRK
jgi:zinc protease